MSSCAAATVELCTAALNTFCSAANTRTAPLDTGARNTGLEVARDTAADLATCIFFGVVARNAAMLGLNSMGGEEVWELCEQRSRAS